MARLPPPSAILFNTPLGRVSLAQLSRWQLGELLGITGNEVDGLVNRLKARAKEASMTIDHEPAPPEEPAPKRRRAQKREQP